MKKSILFLFLIVPIIVGAYTSPSLWEGRGGFDYNLSYISMREGLPSNSVTDIFEDSYGFMWIASDVGGLVRYDGYSFLHPNLRSNSCRNVCEDRFGRLWIAFNEGVNVLDLKTMQEVSPGSQQKQLPLSSLTTQLLSPLSTLHSSLSSLMNKAAKRVFLDSSGCVWLITNNEVCRIAFDEQGQVASLQTHTYSVRALDIIISDVEGNGNPWVAIDGSIYRMVSSGGQLQRQEVSSQLRTAISGNYITAMLHEGNNAWIGTNEGLVSFNMTTGQVQRYTTATGAIPHNFITCLLAFPPSRGKSKEERGEKSEDIGGSHLLVGTLGGIVVMGGQIGDFPLPSNFVHTLYSTHGCLWVGTDNAGIVKFTPRYLNLNWMSHNDNPGSLSRGCVNALYAQPDGTLWVGTVEGGLNMLTSQTSNSQHPIPFQHFTTANTRLSHNSVSDIKPGRGDTLWIGTWGGGVSMVDSWHPSQLQPLVVQPSYQQLIAFVGALAYDHLNNGLWIGSNAGIYFYNLATQQIEEPYEGCRDERGCIGSVIDRENRLWMGCLEGMRIIHLKRKSPTSKFTVERLRNKLDRPQSGITEKITCFCLTADGHLWLGSNGYGLYQLTSQTSNLKLQTLKFKNYTTADGLVNNAVKGIVEDDNGQLWIATDNGLSRMDPHTGKFTNFGHADGLPSTQFYWNAATKSADGHLLLGTTDGLVEIVGYNPEANYDGQLRFTRLYVANQEVTDVGSHLDRDISSATLIRLHESDKSFAVAFSALNYSGGQPAAYSYRLVGFDNHWTQLPAGQHEVRYTNLPAGNYTLQVRHSPLVEGEMKSNELSIDIHVSPYFWKSSWFMFLVALLVVLLAAYAYNRRVETLRRREAERLMEPITQVLRESDAPQQLQARIASILSNHRRYRESSAKSVEADTQEQLKNTIPFMEQVMTIVEQNYMNSDFGVSQFCNLMGMSRSLLAKRLNEETGQNTIQFIRNYRLDIARQLLLRAHQRNIAEIAFSVGFNDPKYFTRCFTKQYGVSPKYFDENYGNKQNTRVEEDV